MNVPQSARNGVGTSVSSDSEPSRSTVTCSGRPIRSPTIKSLQIGRVSQRLTLDPDQHVAGAHARAFGGAALDDAQHGDPAFTVQLLGDRRRQRRRCGGDPDLGAIDAAVTDQRRDDRAGGVVDRHRQPEPDARDRRVDADDATVPVGQRATGVARVQRGVGLDHVLDQAVRTRGVTQPAASARGR